MKLWRVTWYLSQGWSITGRVYAPNSGKAIEFAEKRLREESPQWADLPTPEVSPICEVA